MNIPSRGNRKCRDRKAAAWWYSLVKARKPGVES